MTAQIHERLIYESVETSMACCPRLPKFHSRIVKRKDDLNNQESILRSTACWRGYQGTWEIREGRFYLIELAGRFQLVGSEPLFARWFSGTLRIPRGELLHYVHMGFGSVYEEEVHVRIKRGLVVGTRLIDNRAKEYDPRLLGWQNLPGFESRFEGDGRTLGFGLARLLAKWSRRLFG